MRHDTWLRDYLHKLGGGRGLGWAGRGVGTGCYRCMGSVERVRWTLRVVIRCMKLLTLPGQENEVIEGGIRLAWGLNPYIRPFVMPESVP